MTDDGDVWPVEDEPSPEDFEAAEDEDVAKPFLVRVLRAVVAVAVIVVVLVYFGVPTFRWFRRSVGPHPIPIAPPQESLQPLSV